MRTVGLFAYGETGLSALSSLRKKFDILWIILPPEPLLKASDIEDQIELYAKQHGIPIIKTNSAKEIGSVVTKKVPDAIVISSYNKILPEKILTKTICINIHHGDLPRWRGRANINWAILNGRKDIGLTFHQAIPDLDAGNIYAQYMVSITDTDTVKTIYEKFNDIIEKKTADIVKKVLGGYKGRKQVGRATYCCTRLPEDGLIDWTKKTIEIDRLIRALTKPYPGAFTYFDGKKMAIWDSEIVKNPRVYEGRIPGRVVGIYPGKGVEVLTGDAMLLIKTVWYDNKERNASEVITSVKKSLGIDISLLYETMLQKDLS